MDALGTLLLFGLILFARGKKFQIIAEVSALWM